MQIRQSVNIVGADGQLLKRQDRSSHSIDINSLYTYNYPITRLTHPTMHQIRQTCHIEHMYTFLLQNGELRGIGLVHYGIRAISQFRDSDVTWVLSRFI